jgi:prevent-host-death family protein
MAHISPQDIPTQLPDILNRVARGEEFVVTDHGRAVARIVPPADDHAGRPAAPDWPGQFDDWMRAVDARADRYPAGFTLDDSRDAIDPAGGE